MDGGAAFASACSAEARNFGEVGFNELSVVESCGVTGTGSLNEPLPIVYGGGPQYMLGTESMF